MVKAGPADSPAWTRRAGLGVVGYRGIDHRVRAEGPHLTQGTGVAAGSDDPSGPSSRAISELAMSTLVTRGLPLHAGDERD